MIRQSDIESARLQRKMLTKLGEAVPDDVHRLAEMEDVPLPEKTEKEEGVANLCLALSTAFSRAQAIGGSGGSLSPRAVVFESSSSDKGLLVIAEEWERLHRTVGKHADQANAGEETLFGWRESWK